MQGNGADWCSGDCVWKHDQCVSGNLFNMTSCPGLFSLIPTRGHKSTIYFCPSGAQLSTFSGQTVGAPTVQCTAVGPQGPSIIFLGYLGHLKMTKNYRGGIPEWFYGETIVFTVGHKVKNISICRSKILPRTAANLSCLAMLFSALSCSFSLES